MSNKASSHLVWGAVRTETVSAGDDDISLHGVEDADIERLAATVEDFIHDFLKRAGIGSDELEEALLQDPWTLGYAFGACSACFSQYGIASDTGLIGFGARVCGKLLGGGIKCKVAAFDQIKVQSVEPAFAEGQERAIQDWLERRHQH